MLGGMVARHGTKDTEHGGGMSFGKRWRGMDSEGYSTASNENSVHIRSASLIHLRSVLSE
jgi:hypothetical protein